MTKRSDELFRQLAEIPVVDVHSHISRDRMHSPGLDHSLFYHMLTYVMRSAGLDIDKLWAGPKDPNTAPRDDFVRAWPMISQTGFGRILKAILRDLYDFDGPFTEKGIEELDKIYSERNARPDWPREVLRKANVVRICSSEHNVEPLKDGQWGGNIRFTTEKTPSGGTHEYKTWTDRFTGLGERLGRDVKSRADLEEAIRLYYDAMSWQDKEPVLVAWVSSAADFTPIDDDELARLLTGLTEGREPGQVEARLLEGAFLRAICKVIREYVRVFQLCYGVQFLSGSPKNPIQRAAPSFAQTFGYLLGEFPDLHFNLLNGYENDDPIWCGLCQGYGNISLTSHWWTAFFPTAMHGGWSRRFDMVPLNRLCAFLSDGWSVDYVYGRLWMTRRVLANVLAERIERGLMNGEEALAAARRVLFETPGEIFLPDERIDPSAAF